VSVAGELNAVSKARSQIVHELHCVFAVATAHQIGQDHLAVRVDCSPRPRVARAFRCVLCRCDVLLLGVGERPNFIDLHSRRFHVAHVGVVIGGTRLARVNKQLGDCVLARSGQPRNGADAHTFAKKVEDFCTLFDGQLVHIAVLADPSDYASIKVSLQFWEN